MTRHLVVVVPGIGGSVLVRDGETVWGKGLPSLAQRVLDPEALTLAPDDGIRAVGLVKSAAILPGFTVIHGYSELVDQLTRRLRIDAGKVDKGHPDRPRLDADVVLFPYDFRGSMECAAKRLAATVTERLKIKARPVIVVAHSMGGLVARYWLGALDGWRCCRALITLGTPHMGAPKALAWLVNGVRLGRLPLPDATEVIRGWPSVHELLPRGLAVLDGQTDRPFRLTERSLPGLAARRVKDAFALHEQIEDDWEEIAEQPAAPTVVPFVGCEQPTLDRAVWRAGRLTVRKCQAEWREQPEWAGDGTVPAHAAAPRELFTRPELWRRPALRHGALAGYREAVELVATIEQLGLPPTRGEEELRAALGVDVEEWYAAGEPVPLAAVLHSSAYNPEAADAPAIRVWARLSREGSRARVAEVELERRDGGWAGEATGLAAGVYELAVSATGVPSGEPRPVREVFAVVGS